MARCGLTAPACYSLSSTKAEGPPSALRTPRVGISAFSVPLPWSRWQCANELQEPGQTLGLAPAPGVIATDCLIAFPTIGYEVLSKNSDDAIPDECSGSCAPVCAPPAQTARGRFACHLSLR